MTENGTGAVSPLLPQVTELVMSSGVTIWVRPMSLNDQRMILDKVVKQFPEPLEKDYRVPVPEDQASFEGQTMLDADAFLLAKRECNVKRDALWIHGHIMTCVDFPEGVDAIVERYKPEIDRKRRFLDLPEDDLEAIIFHSVVTTIDDERLIRQAVTQQLPVDLSEVKSQLRIFRPTLERGVDHPLPNGRKKTAPRAGMVQEQA